MATEYELTFFDYLSIMRRRALYLIGIFVAGLLIAIVVAFTIPPVYRSTGTIMVESQQVPENMVPSAIRNQIDDRINAINQRVMTRENLLQIANKYSLFKEKAGSMTTTELIDKMRGRIIVEPVRPNDALTTNRQGQPIIAFTISFEDWRPEVALQVAKDLVALFLDWNVKLRTEGAMETTSFLAQESEKLKAEVDRLEGMIAAYKRENSNNLPEQLTLRAAMLARAENDLYAVERDIRSAEAELAAAKQDLGEVNPAQTLPALKAELTRLSAIYTESHPDIRALKRKIDALENPSGTQKSEFASAEAPSQAVYMIQPKLDAAKSRLDSLTRQKKMLQIKIAQNEHAMMQTPKAAQELDVLIRDRDSAQKKYEEILGKKMNAKIAENLESESKSERFFLLEPPILPEKPFKPDRTKIFALGFFLALVSSGGTIMVLETIDKRIRGTEALTHVLGHRPMAVIPYFTNQEDEIRRKRIFKRAIIAAVVALIAAVVAIHFLYMPLDTLFVKIMSKF